MESKKDRSEFERRISMKIMEIFEEENMDPNRVLRSDEESTVFCFIKNDKYADIEVYDDGEILSIISDGSQEPIVFEIKPNDDDLRAAIFYIDLFLRTGRRHNGRQNT